MLRKSSFLASLTCLEKILQKTVIFFFLTLFALLHNTYKYAKSDERKSTLLCLLINDWFCNRNKFYFD